MQSRLRRVAARTLTHAPPPRVAPSHVACPPPASTPPPIRRLRRVRRLSLPPHVPPAASTACPSSRFRRIRRLCPPPHPSLVPAASAAPPRHLSIVPARLPSPAPLSVRRPLRPPSQLLSTNARRIRRLSLPRDVACPSTPLPPSHCKMKVKLKRGVVCVCRPLGVPQWITPTHSCAIGACCGSETPSHTTHSAICCPAMQGTCRHLSSPHLPLVPAASVGAFLHHIGLWSAPSVSKAICLPPHLSAVPLTRLLCRIMPPYRAAVPLSYHAAETRRRIEPRYRRRRSCCRNASPYRAPVSLP